MVGVDDADTAHEVREEGRPGGYSVPERRVLAVSARRRWFAAEVAVLRRLANWRPERARTKDPTTADLRERLTDAQRQRAENVAPQLWDEAVVAASQVLADLASDVQGGEQTDDGDGSDRWYPKPEELAVLVMQRVGPEGVQARAEGALETLGGDEDALLYAMRLVEQRGWPDASELLCSALLVRLVSSFEAMLAGFVRTWMLPREPASLDDAGARRSLSEASRAASKVMGGRWNGTRPWTDWLTAEVGIDLGTAAPASWPLVHEALARRHAIVHADATADQRYLERLGNVEGLPKLGTRLLCDANYLGQALAGFETVADLIAAGFATRLGGESALAVTLVTETVYQALENRSYAEAEWLADTFLRSIPDGHGQHELVVNRWLARRERHGLDAVRSEVLAWEPPGEERYQLAKAALLFDEEAACQVLLSWVPEPKEARRVTRWPLVQLFENRSERFGKCVQRWLLNTQVAAGSSGNLSPGAGQIGRASTAKGSRTRALQRRKRSR